MIQDGLSDSVEKVETRGLRLWDPLVCYHEPERPAGGGPILAQRCLNGPHSKQDPSFSLPRNIILLIAATLCLTHCRITRDTAGQQPIRAAKLSIKSEIVAPQGDLKPFSDDDLEEVVWVSANGYPGAPTEIHGFDDAREIWCLPLKDEGRCLKMPNPWSDRCHGQGGVIKRCQDCREICDKPLAAHETP